MRHSLWATLVLLLWPSSASAAWTFVGHQGFGGDTAAGATVSATISSNIPAASIVIAVCSAHVTVAGADGETTTHSVSDTDGHTWTLLHEHLNEVGANDVAKATSQISTSDSVTCNSGDADSLGKTVDVLEFTVDSGNTFSRADSEGAPTSGVATAIDTTISGLGSAARLWIGISLAASTSGTYTLDADYTSAIGVGGSSTGTAATSVRRIGGYRIATLTGDTYTTTLSVSRELIGELIALDEVVDGAPPAQSCHLLLLGVGCEE
jgi:hypothetical protein